MKKGFTLIELLAVIVILAIIALIATPIVLNIINDTRESAKIRSAELYIEALEQAIVRKKLNDLNFNPSSCEISQGVVTCEGMDEPLKVEADGALPTSGEVTINNGKVEYYEIKFDVNDKYIVYENGEIVFKDKILYSVGDEYILKNKANFKVVATDETINNFNIELYNIVVLDDGSEWYYLSEDGDTVTLLSKYNYFTTGDKVGEMDPSGNVNAMAAVSEIYEKEFISSCYPDNCDENGENCEEICDTYTEEWFDTDYITLLINNSIKPKLLRSLKTTEIETTVELLTGSDVTDIIGSMGIEGLHISPSYWIKDGNGACVSAALVYQPVDQAARYECMSYPDNKSDGVRVKLTIPKSYIKLILYPNINSSLKFYYADLSNFEIIEDTDEYILILDNSDNFFSNFENNTIKVLIENTKYEVKNYTALGIDSVIYELGYSLDCDETMWCTVNFGNAPNQYDLPSGFVMGEYQGMILSKIYK